MLIRIRADQSNMDLACNLIGRAATAGGEVAGACVFPMLG
jgi:hypothetical protein